MDSDLEYASSNDDQMLEKKKKAHYISWETRIDLNLKSAHSYPKITCDNQKYQTMIFHLLRISFLYRVRIWVIIIRV